MVIEDRGQDRGFVCPPYVSDSGLHIHMPKRAGPQITARPKVAIPLKFVSASRAMVQS